jgi:hypothetical protein
MKFYITFGQKSPFRNGYVVIEAINVSVAHEIAMNSFGNKWAWVYSENEIRKEFFPLGQIGATLK